MANLTMEQVAGACYQAGFTSEAKLSTAVAVAWAESGGRSDVVNFLGCTGLFQIYIKVHIGAHPSWTTNAMKVPFNNAKAAYTLSSGGVNWKPWEAYTKGMHKKYMGPATKAARKLIAAMGGSATKTVVGASGISLSRTLALAASQIGYVETGENRTKFWQELRPSWQGKPWCGAFTHWLLKHNGLDMTTMGLSNPYSTPEIVKWAKKDGRWTSTPKPGFLILFTWSKDRHAQHVGIVEKVLSGGRIQTIEGNTSPDNRGSQNNGGGVWRKTRSGSSILGYVRIDYDNSIVAGSRGVPDDVTKVTDVVDPNKLVESGAWDRPTMLKLAAISNMPMPLTSNKAYWRWIEEWCGLTGKWVDGDLDYVTIQALQWRTNQAIIDGAWNSRTIIGIQHYLNTNTI